MGSTANHNRQNSIGSVAYSQHQNSVQNNERKYPSTTNGGSTLLTADEKVAELNEMMDDQRRENEHLRLQLEQVGSDKITFVREKIDSLVNKEVQLKLNNIAASEQQTNSQKSKKINNALKYCIGEEVQALKGQLDHTFQEKQAYILISNDIQGILQSAMSTITQPSNDPNKLPFVA